MRKTVVGVMGPGEKATKNDLQNAYELGKGAKSGKGLTIGILPNSDQTGISEAVDIAIFTDMGNARNNINILSSDVVIACGMGAGTASEIALALKAKKQVILLTDDVESKSFFQSMSPENVYIVESVADAIATIKAILKNQNL
ncbi:cytochrome [Nostoc sp. UHCC 0702]|nr:cytochrome [Nostoc sp. UHCC 0702]